MTPCLAGSARATARSGVAEALGWHGPSLFLLGYKKEAQGMADDLIATAFEAEAGLEGIEIAVEFLAQGNGHSDGQHTGRLVSFGTSSGHVNLHVEPVLQRKGGANGSPIMFILYKRYFL